MSSAAARHYRALVDELAAPLVGYEPCELCKKHEGGNVVQIGRELRAVCRSCLPAARALARAQEVRRR